MSSISTTMRGSQQVGGVVGGQVLGARLAQPLTAGQLASEHHDVAADRLEVIAGGERRR